MTNEEFERQVRVGVEEIRKKYPNLKGVAGAKLILERVARFAGHSDCVPSLALYELSLQNPPTDAENDEAVVQATRAAMNKPRTGKSIPPAHEINYGAAKADKERVAEKEARDRANDEAWEQILSEYPIASHDANKAIVMEWCQGQITLERFRFLIGNKSLTLDWTDEREKLLTAVCELLHDPFGRRMTEFSLKQERSKMSYWTRQQLRARLAELRTKQAMAKDGGKGARELLAASRQQEAGQRPYDGYPTLLPTIVPSGQIQSVKTRDYLIHVSKTDYYEFKKFVRLYGSQQVSDIMDGRRY